MRSHPSRSGVGWPGAPGFAPQPDRRRLRCPLAPLLLCPRDAHLDIDGQFPEMRGFGGPVAADHAIVTVALVATSRAETASHVGPASGVVRVRGWVRLAAGEDAERRSHRQPPPDSAADETFERTPSERTAASGMCARQSCPAAARRRRGACAAFGRSCRERAPLCIRRCKPACVAGDARSRFEGDTGAEVNHEPCGPAASGA